MKEEVIKRIAQLLINGNSRKIILNKILSGELVANKVTESIANKWIDEALLLLDIDIGEEAKLEYSRLLNIYKGCIEKKDYANALKCWKELKEYTSVNNEDIVIQFIK